MRVWFVVLLEGKQKINLSAVRLLSRLKILFVVVSYAIRRVFCDSWFEMNGLINVVRN